MSLYINFYLYIKNLNFIVIELLNLNALPLNIAALSKYFIYDK